MYQEGAGNHFFEKSAWTEEAVRQYFTTDHCSEIDPAARAQWMKTNYEPYNARRHRWNQLKVNPCRKWPSMAGSLLMRRLQRN